jgi:formate hydrogenlyase subunit 6/NADH:ubiquinone oxidoreductase subunit I
MRIDQEKCLGCGQCLLFCPFNAITLTRGTKHTSKTAGSGDFAQIDFEECVECSNCLCFADCPTDAISQQELVWPRIVRSILSNQVLL